MDQAITKADLESALQRFSTVILARVDAIDTRLNAIDTRLNAIDTRLDSMEKQIQNLSETLNQRIDNTLETIRDVETHMLTEFHGYAKGVSNRLHTQEVTDNDLKERLHHIELRILELERRIRPH